MFLEILRLLGGFVFLYGTCIIYILHVVVCKAIWMTRSTEADASDKNIKIQATLRELVIYIVFLLIMCLGLFSARNCSHHRLISQDTTPHVDFGDNFTKLSLCTLHIRKLDFCMFHCLYWLKMISGDCMMVLYVVFQK